MFPTIWLSPTTLNMVRDCPRCMWEHVVWKQKRPQGAFPSLPRGVDDAMKGYCDQYRGSLPPALKRLAQTTTPELNEFVLHQDQRWMNILRDWKGGLVATIKLDSQQYRISGSVDDLLVRDSDGALATIDGKSKAKKPEPGEGAKYYLSQMDTYELLLKKCGHITTGQSFLWYVCPVSFEDRDTNLPSANLVFDQSIQVLEVSADRAMAQIEEVHKMIMDHPDRSKPPVSGQSCDYCNWAGR
jgi:PD-(D/E)XK nuclease superfamily